MGAVGPDSATTQSAMTAGFSNDLDQRIGDPHVIVVVDILTDETSVLGPFAEPMSALVFADQYVRDVGAEPGSLLLTITTLDPT
jgi:hypothetical protein